MAKASRMAAKQAMAVENMAARLAAVERKLDEALRLLRSLQPPKRDPKGK